MARVYKFKRMKNGLKENENTGLYDSVTLLKKKKITELLSCLSRYITGFVHYISINISFTYLRGFLGVGNKGCMKPSLI